MARVLLCGDETPGSLATVRALRAAGHEPWVAVSRPGTYVSRSRDVAGTDSIPESYGHSAEAAARALADVAARRHAEAVLPGSEGTLVALTGREHLFPADTVVGVASSEALDRATDKGALHELAAAAGLDSLPSLEVGAADLHKRTDELPLPGVAKPHHAAEELPSGRISSATVHMVDDVEALRRVIDAQPELRWFVQRRVTGTLAAIGGVAWEGRLVCAVHQVSPRIWPPGRGITAFAVTVPPDAARERGVARMLGEIGWSGLFGVQFLLAEGRAYPIDLNPRMYGSIGLAIAAGLNLPAIWTALLLGREPAVGSYRVGVGYRVEEADPRALWAAWRSGARADALRGAMPRRHTAHAVLSLRDPRPTVIVAHRLLKRAARR